MFGREISSATPSRSKSTPDDLVDRLRKKLASRGARGIIGLSKQFRIMDDNRSMSLDKYEFTKAMQDYMLGFSEGELSTLFRTFDFDHSGLIDYDEFLRVLRGPMNPFRKSLTGKAFAKLDRDGNGYVDINDLRGVYSAAKHPDVISGKKTEQQILQEFLETFETAHNMRNNDAPDHIVTKEEFEEYYNTVSASIDDDQYFSVMITSAWNLDGARVTKKAWANEASTNPVTGKVNRPQVPQSTQAPISSRMSDRSNAPSQASNRVGGSAMPAMNYTDAQLVQKLRDALARRGANAIMGIGLSFRIADDNRS
jgi:calcyphosin